MVSFVGRVVDVAKLREDLLLGLERERSEEVAGLRAKQKQVVVLLARGQMLVFCTVYELSCVGQKVGMCSYVAEKVGQVCVDSRVPAIF